MLLDIKTPGDYVTSVESNCTQHNDQSFSCFVQNAMLFMHAGKCKSHLIKCNMFQLTNEQIAELFATCEDAGMILQEIPLFAPKN